MNITSDKVHSLLTWFSLGFAPVGAFFTITTWCNTRKVKTLVNSKLDKKELSKNLENYSLKFKSFIDMLGPNKAIVSSKAKWDFLNLLTELESKYKNINNEIKPAIKPIKKTLSSKLNVPLTNEDKLFLSEKIYELKSILEKEVR